MHFKGVVTLELFITLVALFHFITRLNLDMNKLGSACFSKLFLCNYVFFLRAFLLSVLGQWGDGLLLLFLSPGVQGEVEGRADGEGTCEEDALVGQLLANIQELNAKSSFTVTGRHPCRQG